jgi:hypothetical protein
VKNGIQFNYSPVSSNVKPPSLTVFSLQGKHLGFRESIPAGLSIWKQAAGTTTMEICLVRVRWPDGTSITRSISVVR